MKEVIAANVKAIVATKEGGLDAACRHLGMKETQLKRIMAGKHAITMTTLERIAAAYDYEPYQLLIPGLNTKNPQVLRTLGPVEEKLYKVLEEAIEASKKSGTQ